MRKEQIHFQKDFIFDKEGRLAIISRTFFYSDFKEGVSDSEQ